MFFEENKIKKKLIIYFIPYYEVELNFKLLLLYISTFY